MLEAYFRGKKELFNGLEIASIEEKKGKSAWKTYPVITFYLASGEFNSENGLEDKTRCVIFLAGEGFLDNLFSKFKKFSLHRKWLCYNNFVCGVRTCVHST